ncbi:hypothetical protein WBG78_09705 [Chryseolinea sp. T2]|uniref:hypothetical protein n=1 Tax=Chryseolinea sp. T2 TaxID=3129255 RepID=UPI003078390F
MSLPNHHGLEIDVTSEYAFITIKVINGGQPFAQIRFQLTDEAGKPVSIFCDSNAVQKELSDKIEGENWPGWQSSATIKTKFPEQVLQAMDSADSIAALVTNCTRGDEYSPGNFSKISASNKRIKLEQINYMNSRSLSHKDNYSLRQLVFTINFDPGSVNELRRGEYRIGIMKVEFSDRSSANNRTCGDKVIAELERLTAKDVRSQLP